ncbi:MAG: XRE family transcriptional regulator [Polyangiales bacterium]
MNAAIDARALDRVFGPGFGDSPEQRADASTVEFVRSIDQLAFASEGARGRRLTAREALDAYGLDALLEVADEGSALLTKDPAAAGRVIRERRAQLDLTADRVAQAASLSLDVVEAIEQSKRRPVREYERVARVLGLDERMVSYRAEPVGNERIAVRLRTLQHMPCTGLSAPTVAALAEAAWVAATQVRLERELGLEGRGVGFEHSHDYGAPGWPAYRAGYELATKVRERLQLGDDPIPSLRDLCERRLGIPVIQTELGADFAGATVDASGARAIVLNLAGRNREVFVRRATLAHELCHILFDPPQRLNDLRVDRYDELDRPAEQVVDVVEQRANAFAVELIAPQRASVRLFETSPSEPLAAVIHRFGISFTAARYQVWNGLARRVELTSLAAPNTRPDPGWEAREAYTVDYHPIRSLARHPSRAGRFSAVSLRAAEQRRISWDTAAEWLDASVDEVRDALPAVRSLFPDVFV